MAVLLSAGLLAIELSAATIHVPADQPTIQAGINAAEDGDTVLVADGVYTGAGNHDLFFLGKAITVRSENGQENCVIDCQRAGRGFHIHSGETGKTVLEGFTVRNGYRDFGGGLRVVDAAPTILNCAIEDCESRLRGGGILIEGSRGGTTVFDGCSITGNYAQGAGGGVYIENASVHFTNCKIAFNDSYTSGGGVYCVSGELDLTNTLIRNNWSDGFCGAMKAILSGVTIRYSTLLYNRCEYSAPYSFQFSGSDVHMTDCILWDGGGDMGWAIEGSFLIEYSTVRGGEDAISDHDCEFTWGEGMLEEDPLFTRGGLSTIYLSQTASGQDVDSPCVDAGDPVSEPPPGTTRTDQGSDTGIPDMGYHNSLADDFPAYFVGPGPAPGNPPRVLVLGYGGPLTHLSEFPAYATPKWGVNVAAGDVDGDGLDEVLTGPGPGPVFGPHVRGFELDGTQLPGLGFLAYGTPRFGVNVAAGDLDGDGFDEIVTGAGPGAVFGPHVRAFDYDGVPPVTAVPGCSFFAYGTLKWGVNVAAGDIDGDGFDEIVTGAGPGLVFGPHVRGWNVDGGAVESIPGLSWMAYGTPHYGVRVACGDVDGDGIEEIVTTPGPSPVFGAHVRGWEWDGTTVSPMAGLSFFAWPSGESGYGATISVGEDIDYDGRADILVGLGSDPAAGPDLRVFRYNGSVVHHLFDYAYTAFPGEYTHGLNVAAGRF